MHTSPPWGREPYGGARLPLPLPVGCVLVPSGPPGLGGRWAGGPPSMWAGAYPLPRGGGHGPPPPLPPPAPRARGGGGVYSLQDRRHGVNIGCFNRAGMLKGGVDNTIDVHLDQFHQVEAITRIHGQVRVGCGNHSSRDNVIRVNASDAQNDAQNNYRGRP